MEIVARHQSSSISLGNFRSKSETRLPLLSGAVITRSVAEFHAFDRNRRKGNTEAHARFSENGSRASDFSCITRAGCGGACPSLHERGQSPKRGADCGSGGEPWDFQFAADRGGSPAGT